MHDGAVCVQSNLNQPSRIPKRRGSVVSMSSSDTDCVASADSAEEMQNLRKASALLSTVSEEIRKLITALPDGCALDTVYKQWIQDEMSDILTREKDLSLQWDESYVDLLLTTSNLKSQKEQQPSELDMLERKMSRYIHWRLIERLEKKHGIRVRWQENDATFQNAQQQLSAKKKSKL
ncbi:uncharacterized protein LOC122954497 [Acropora millepora]|uniref:uncharacterized protein LOC122954497 n=1 Tax=Acropora millepora TaxID=45264 RepID=UPI001CF509C6|nr:uncharacterized protein LOC122954497 [Acropora millepora]